MNDNGSHTLTDVFEECLAELEAGMSIEEILVSRPALSGELLPLLETAGAAIDLQPAGPPLAALHRGRTRLLVQAELLRREKPRRRVSWNWPRLALQLTGFMVVVAVSLTSLVAASARSLPGDSLYGFKLAAEDARLSAAGENGRAGLENSLRDLRIDEIRELLRLRRLAQVRYEGVVTSNSGSIWEIAGLRIAVNEDTILIGDILPGMFVEVHGHTTADGRLIAERIYLRAYAFTGALLARNGAIWQIDTVPVLITPETQLAPDLELGDQVVVLAQVDDEGTISARAVLAGQGLLPEPEDPLPGITPGSADPATGTPLPEPTQTGAELETPVPDPEPDPEADPEAEGTDDDDDDDGDVDDDETEEPDDDDDDNSGPDSSSSGSGSDDDETEEPDDD